MRGVIGEILPLAIGVAISPVPIIAVVGAIVLALSDSGDLSDQGSPSTTAGVVQSILGVLLLLVFGVVLIGKAIGILSS